MLNVNNIEGYVFCSLLFLFLILLWVMYKLVIWSQKQPKGALIFLAFLPLISIFPIPPQEIKKLEKIKHENVKRKDESGDPVEK